MAQWVKDLTLSLQRLRADPWPGIFHMPWVWLKDKTKKKKKKKDDSGWCVENRWSRGRSRNWAKHSRKPRGPSRRERMVAQTRVMV